MMNNNISGELGDAETVMPGSEGGQGKRAVVQYLVCGLPYVFWIFTMKNAGGIFGGGIVGSRMGDILGGGGILMVCMLLGAVAGLILTLDRRGLMWGRRYWLAGRWYVRRAYQPTIIEAAAWYEVVEESETPIIIRAAGKTLVAPVREGGTA